jgi:prophage DNA circulation protein
MTTPVLKWREDLRKVSITVDGRTFDAVGASFRGVPFFVESSERGGGRRVVVHEFPLRDEPFVEDMGRRARKFRVEGYVIGGDYMAQRDALLAALEDEEGPGQLVHPYYGIKSAIGETTSTRETRAEGGWAAIGIEFCEAPAQAPTPAIVPDLPGKVAASADAAQLATAAELGEKYDAAGLPAFALASASGAITKASAALAARLAPLIADTQELAGLNSQLTILSAHAAALAHAPGDAVSGMLDAIASLANTAAALPGAVKDALVAAYHDDLGAFTAATTATRARELANQLAITGAIRRVIAIEAARLAPLVPYVSIEDATAARDAVAALLDEQAQGAGDTAYPALVTLRSDVLRAVPGANVFASILTVTRRTAIPSLLLAYQLYGSVDLELDVIARNRIAHPGFIAGDLLVLSAV